MTNTPASPPFAYQKLISAVFSLFILCAIGGLALSSYYFHQQLAALRAQSAQENRDLQSLAHNAQAITQSLEEVKAIQLKNQKNIAALTTQQPPEKLLLWEQVHHLIPSIEALPFATLTPDPDTPSHAQEQPANQAPFTHVKDALWRTWLELKGLVRVTRQSTNSIPLTLALQEKSEVIRTMQLLCEQIKWAILTNNPTVYHHTLAQLDTYLTRYFAKTPERARVLDEIAQLQKKSGDFPTPSQDRGNA